MAYAFALDYTCSILGGYATGTVTLDCTYLTGGRTYQVVGYQVTVNATAGTLWLQGRFYDPDYGHVDVTTPSLVGFSYCGTPTNGYLPTSGQVRVTGVNAAGAIAVGEFTPVDCSQYQLSYTDGANNASGTYNW